MDILRSKADDFAILQYGHMLSDGTGRYFGIPKSLCNILNAANRNTRQIHFDKSFFNAAFAAAITLNNRRFKRNAF